MSGKYKKHKWGVESSWSLRKWSWNLRSKKRHGIRVVCGLQFQPGALGVLFEQALAFQAATYTLADRLNQLFELVFIRCLDALKPRWSVVAIDLSTKQSENNRAEQSHEAMRVRKRGMRRFRSVDQAQRFLGIYAAVSNLFNLGRHRVRAGRYRDLRVSAFTDWSKAVA
jgi:hypothetical protein